MTLFGIDSTRRWSATSIVLLSVLATRSTSFPSCLSTSDFISFLCFYALFHVTLLLFSFSFFILFVFLLCSVCCTAFFFFFIELSSGTQNTCFYFHLSSSLVPLHLVFFFFFVHSQTDNVLINVNFAGLLG